MDARIKNQYYFPGKKGLPDISFCGNIKIQL